jgi:hypothetical protein
MCAIRDLFESPAGREGVERDDAIRAVARGLGFERTGKNIYEAIDSYLIAAARRGIVETVSGRIQLVARSIADYDRGLLKDQFLASLGGYAWTEREEAFALLETSYRRTGGSTTLQVLINGCSASADSKRRNYPEAPLVRRRLRNVPHRAAQIHGPARTLRPQMSAEKAASNPGRGDKRLRVLCPQWSMASGTCQKRLRAARDFGYEVLMSHWAPSRSE